MKKRDYQNHASYRRVIEMDEEIASGKFPNVQYFMDKFEVSEATVLRDIERLRNDFNADVEYDRSNKGYYYTSPSFRLPAMFTTEKQIIAAKLMSNLLATIKGTQIYDKAIEVFASLSNNIDKDANLDAKKLSNRILFLGMSPVKVEDEIWETLEKALVANNYVSFKYPVVGKKAKITVQPWQLIYSEGMWTLYAFNSSLNDTRFYNLPNIKDIKIEAATFELPKDFEYGKRAKGNFRRYIGKETLTYKIRITSEYTLNYIKTYKWASDQIFEEHSDGSTVMTFTSNQDYPILGWLLSHGMYAQPLEPKWLVNEWKKNVREMARTI